MAKADQNRLEKNQLGLGIELAVKTVASTKAPSLPSPNFFVRPRRPEASLVFATYWRFAAVRQELFFGKIFDHETRKPISDPTLMRHKFTNVYRASDRVSQYLIRHVLYNENWSAENFLFRLLIFKFFNKIETWEALESEFGLISWESFNLDRYDQYLSKLMASGATIYSAAYIMASGRSAFGHARKHSNHLEVIQLLMNGNVAQRIAQLPDLESVYTLLLSFPCIGSFLGYQLAIDLNYSTLLNFSEDNFVVPGPGALDGIAKCFTNLGDYSPSDIIHYMVEVQEVAFERIAPSFENLWGRRLHLIDCQNLFCEVGKYARAVHPEVRGNSDRSRIKQIYRKSPRPQEAPWYPPKWGINDTVATDLRWNRLRR
ncbi:MAG: hypothetical protein JKY98_11125 [Gammaproteobacteria bacterium]|nr:hypothetical protein [Gammaproteobacteria bacterium]